MFTILLIPTNKFMAIPDNAYLISFTDVPRLIQASMAAAGIFGSDIKFRKFIADRCELIAQFEEGEGVLADCFENLNRKRLFDFSETGYDDLDRASRNLSKRLKYPIIFITDRSCVKLDVAKRGNLLSESISTKPHEVMLFLDAVCSRVTSERCCLLQLAL